MAAFASVGHLATTPFPVEAFLSFPIFFIFYLFCPMICFLACFIFSLLLIYVTNQGEPTL
jgi:hypothetical protein